MSDQREIQPAVIPIWPDAGKALGFKSRSAAYGAASRGIIPVVRLGGRKMVSMAALERMLGIHPTAPIPRVRSWPAHQPAEPGRRVFLKLRVTAAVKNKIDNAAIASGRSQSEEAERIIELGMIFETLIIALGQYQVVSAAVSDLSCPPQGIPRT